MSRVTQEIALQRHLAAGHSITPLQALRKFGIGRLAARIHGLRKRWTIRSKLIRVGRSRVARYVMVRG